MNKERFDGSLLKSENDGCPPPLESLYNELKKIFIFGINKPNIEYSLIINNLQSLNQKSKKLIIRI